MCRRHYPVYYMYIGYPRGYSLGVRDLTAIATTAGAALVKSILSVAMFCEGD